jgi:hypothetical protein
MVLLVCVPTIPERKPAFPAAALGPEGAKKRIRLVMFYAGKLAGKTNQSTCNSFLSEIGSDVKRNL